MTWPSLCLISSSTALSRSSNWPRYCAPATIAPRSSATMLLPRRRLRDVAVDDALGEPLDDGGLADAGLADEHRVVLRAPAQHLDDAADLGVAADDRVELAAAGAVGEVDAVLLERLVGRLGVLRGDAAHAAAHLGERVDERLGQRLLLLEQLGDVAAGVGEPDEQVLGRDVVVADLLGLGLRDAHDGHERARQAGRGDAGAARLGQRGEQRLGARADVRGVGADGGQQRAGDAVALVEQREQQVHGGDLGVALGGGAADGRRDGLLALGGQAVGVHGRLLSCVVRRCGATPAELSVFRSGVAGRPGRSPRT